MSRIENQFNVQFWGVRGSIPSPGLDTVRYGGNTSCVSMQVGGKRLIFDAGTGLHILGKSLLSQMPVEGHLFFTHSHWDHIQGFPFFAPAFISGNKFDIYGAIAPDGSTIEQRLNDQMLHPNFPVPLQIMQSNLTFHNIQIGQPINIDDIIIETAHLNHPGEAVGYRVSWQGGAAVYITDTEHYPDHLDENVLWLARNADVLIYDSTYSDEEYSHPKLPKIGWGHSTWQEAIKVAKAANVKTLVIYHHDPAHNDDYLDRVGEAACASFPGAIMAKEGLVIPVTTTDVTSS
ncbi:MBL fold metallo-hydrolase [Dolichospermum sp. LEGE 00240]|uniref:MBL fold metallo-hydrolase n=1 Tax=Dolichospermum sp. LEGE 00240 TaxID=1828603 RepID=UPI00187F952D|nr:MBL fold metallo-hydrolase [Dolichospermum sp. LEGE 00240]MDM3844055.1 MBL fold metallo-hydrolase [Aphanizomenon gracile PMC638.10]MDM3853252.1 MBL fold metallo-hydrolase [Aphanizomenon gracile PMC627.10]MDM3854563.1 MBL fold metallo-hydrolase [Aphanizomenon gracile PMC649.10]MDM3862445.1 MBL fold metallo-hydrolase [Aphanizomenon gracile PMC644.10]MBE9251386.1 MBL fold metallo-hydrolase [Dolichospermum sp. LEGE 00240]